MPEFKAADLSIVLTVDGIFPRLKRTSASRQEADDRL